MWDFMLAAGLGAAAQEVLHWYDLRGKLGSERIEALLRSKEYWAITIATILICPPCCWLLIGPEPVSTKTAFLAGAGFPLLFKKGVSAFADKDQTPLGDASFRDYFLLFGRSKA